MRVPARWWAEEAVVQTYLGETSVGREYAEPRVVACQVDHTRKVVIDTTGDEVVSDLTLRSLPQNADLLVEGSRVHVQGRDVTILTRRIFTVAGAPVYVEASA